VTDGSLRFDDFQERALYDPAGGFYATGGRAGGRGGDFLTSPEVGPLFGTVLAAAVRRRWQELGEPSGFTVIEAGAGRGTLAVAMRAAGLPAGSRHVLVERSAVLRDEAVARLGPEVEVGEDLPIGPVVGVVLANELLDNLPARVVERRDGSWAELWVTATGEEELRDLPDAPLRGLDVPVGTRLPVVERAAAWVVSARALLSRGSVISIDYGTTNTAELAGRSWLRTYRGHERGTDPLVEPGAADLTIDVPLDQLPTPDRVVTQAEFLREHGIEELVEEGRRVWRARAHVGDLDAIRHRSRVTEAEALTDGDGLGGFLVAEWRV
jgi:SAM-dependent MidA family methyltransferase